MTRTKPVQRHRRVETKRPPVHPSEPAYPCCLPALGRFTRWTPHEGLKDSVPGLANGAPGNPVIPRSVSCRTEDSPRGLGRTLGKRVGFTPSRVRISYPPPVPHRARCRRALPFAVGPFAVVRLSFRLSWLLPGRRRRCLAAPRARLRLAGRPCGA